MSEGQAQGKCAMQAMQAEAADKTASAAIKACSFRCGKTSTRRAGAWREFMATMQNRPAGLFLETRET